MGGLPQQTKERRRSRLRGLQKQTRKIKHKLHVAGRLSRLEQRHRLRPRLARPLARSRPFVPAAGLQPRLRSAIRMPSRQSPCKLIVPPLELPHGRTLSPPKITPAARQAAAAAPLFLDLDAGDEISQRERERHGRSGLRVDIYIGQVGQMCICTYYTFLHGALPTEDEDTDK
jgi:hypothetical protein